MYSMYLQLLASELTTVCKVSIALLYIQCKNNRTPLGFLQHQKNKSDASPSNFEMKISAEKLVFVKELTE